MARRQVAAAGRTGAAVALLALIAFALAIAVNQTVFELFSGDDDDAVYVLQAETLREGDLTLPAGDYEPFFRPWLSGIQDDRIVFPFQHGWPAVLATSDLLFGSMVVALGLAAAAFVVMCWLLAREVLEDRIAAAVATAMVALSPFVVIQSGTYLNYLFTLLLEVTFAVLVLQGLRLRSRARFAGAGFVLGLVLLTRPYDAVLVALVFAPYCIIRLRARPRDLFTLAAWALGGLSGPLVALFALNQHLTGGALTFPEAVNGGIQEFGFGRRRIAEGTPIVDYGLTEASDAFVTNLRALPKWLFGHVVALTLALVTLLRRRLGAAGWLLAALAVVFPVGYLFWWGNLLSVTGRDSLGPHYYLPVVVPVAILAADTLVGLWRHRQALGVAVAAAVVAMTAAIVPSTWSETHFETDTFARGHAVIDDAGLSDAVVFLPSEPGERGYVLHPLPYLGNPPNLSASVLYVAERGSEDFELLDRYPRRQPYRFRFSAPDDGNVFATEPLLVRLSTTHASRLEVTMTVRNPGADTPLATAYLMVGDEIVQTVALDDRSRRGAEYQVRWSLVPGAAESQMASANPRSVGLPPAATLAFGASFAASEPLQGTRHELRVPFEASDDVGLLLPGEQWQLLTLTEPVWFRVHDEGVLRSFAAVPAGG